MALALVMASGVALAVAKIGTNGNDTLIGTNRSDVLAGKGGADDIQGRRGQDTISGGPGNDYPAGIRFRALDGGPGADVISGGAGNDLLTDGGDFAKDTLSGGAGDDYVIAANQRAVRDIVSCGRGNRDFASVDRKDIVARDCEDVAVRH